MPYSIGSDNNSDKDNDFLMMILLLMNPASEWSKWLKSVSLDLFWLRNVGSINSIRSMFFILQAHS